MVRISEIATRVLGLITEQAFAEGAWEKLFATVLAPNRASARVLENNGYQLEGVLKHEVVKDGRIFDVLHYARHRT